MDLTFALALYAAVIATSVAVLFLQREARDEGRLSLNLKLSKIIRSSCGEAFFVEADCFESAQLILTVANTGRRPVTVTTLGGDFCQPQEANRSFEMSLTDLPWELHEGEERRQAIQDYRRFLELGVKRLWVLDLKGRRWPFPSRQLASVVKDFKSLICAERGLRTGDSAAV